MAVDTREPLSRVKNMEKEFILIVMEIIMMDNGLGMPLKVKDLLWYQVSTFKDSIKEDKRMVLVSKQTKREIQ